MNVIKTPVKSEATSDITKIQFAPCMTQFVSMRGDYPPGSILRNQAKSATIAGKFPMSDGKISYPLKGPRC